MRILEQARHLYWVHIHKKGEMLHTHKGGVLNEDVGFIRGHGVEEGRARVVGPGGGACGLWDKVACALPLRPCTSRLLTRGTNRAQPADG